MSRLRRVLGWLWRPVGVAEPTGSCPECGRPVVVAREHYVGRLGAIVVRRTRQELVAACPVHGRATPRSSIG